jgi:actin-related protein 10
MLPGFITRLHEELLHAMDPPSATRPPKRNRHLIPNFDRYASLRPLLPHFAILNNPNPPAGSSSERTPAFNPSSLAWVGGSLAGCVGLFVMGTTY